MVNARYARELQFAELVYILIAEFANLTYDAVKIVRKVCAKLSCLRTTVIVVHMEIPKNILEMKELMYLR